MGVSAKRFQEGDVYVSYDYEKVMFRWSLDKKKCFRKFIGEEKEMEVPFNNKLFNDAIMFGEEIDEDEYHEDQPAKT